MKINLKAYLEKAKKTGWTFETVVKGLQSMTNDPPEVIRKELKKAFNDLRTPKVNQEIRQNIQ